MEMGGRHVTAVVTGPATAGLMAASARISGSGEVCKGQWVWKSCRRQQQGQGGQRPSPGGWGGF